MNTQPRLDKELRALRHDASRVMKDISEISRNFAGNTAQENPSESGAAIPASVDATLRELTEKVSRLRESFAEYQEKTDKHVRAHPYGYMLAALGIGTVLGKLVSLRQSS